MLVVSLHTFTLLLVIRNTTGLWVVFTPKVFSSGDKISKCHDTENVTNTLVLIVVNLDCRSWYSAPPPTPHRVLPYLGMAGRFRGDDPRFWDFLSDWVPVYASSRSDWSPLSVARISLSLSHFVREIFGTKIGLIYHQNVLFNSF